MTGRKSPATRRTAPVLEPLEGRQLLNARMIAPNGKPINDKDAAHAFFVKTNGVSLANRRIAYTTPDGAQVQLTLFGAGTLAGTSVRPDGSLDLVYNHTTTTSKIVGHVLGGSGNAPLASIRDADVTARSPSSTGSDPINVVNLKHFDLIAGGYINLTGGVSTLALHSASTDSQIHMTGQNVPTTSTSVNTNTTGTTLNTVTTGGVTTIVPGGSTSVGTTTNPTPLGSEVSIPRVIAAPRSVPLGPPQIFGFDPTAGTLVRFDATTGDVLQSIPVPGGGTSIAGVGLGRNNGSLVAMIGTGTTITAFDAITGAEVGHFSTASLAANGLHTIDGIGSSDTRTFVSDSSAGANGLIQSIDVTASLRTGQAVAIGSPFAPAREFELSGGVTGLAGSAVVYTSGAAHFDPAVPDQIQEGILGFTPTATGVRETSRAPVINVLTGTDINVGPPGSAKAHPTMALGSIGTSLALVTGVFDGQNVVTLLNPATNATTGVSTLTAIGAVNLNDPHLLSGLSESFHPELAGGMLLDVSGNLRRFVGSEATGLVINVSGAVNLVQIGKATDTAIVGRPLNHVNIPIRNNVTLLSTSRGPRGTGMRNGVTVSKTLRPYSPLTLP